MREFFVTLQAQVAGSVCCAREVPVHLGSGPSVTYHYIYIYMHIYIRVLGALPKVLLARV